MLTRSEQSDRKKAIPADEWTLSKPLWRVAPASTGPRGHADWGALIRTQKPCQSAGSDPSQPYMLPGSETLHPCVAHVTRQHVILRKFLGAKPAHQAPVRPN